MKHVLLQIGKHSSIYMISQVVTNGLSVVMLPIYLRYFAPAEFGCVALIELAMALMINAVAQGMIAALNRFHFVSKSDNDRAVVWWTGSLYVAGAMAVGGAAMILSADRLAHTFLGPEFPRGPWWIRIATLAMWLEVQGMVFLSYLRANKRSSAIMTLTIVRATVFVACAIPGVVLLQGGPTATFLANLAAAAALAGVGYLHVARGWGRPRFSRTLLKELWRYGWPFFITGVLLIMMQSINRLFVERLLNLEQVGLLSLGVQIADKVNRLIVMPFQQIWGMLIYELHEEHPQQALRTYSVVFELFCYLLISVFFGCSVAAGPVLSLIARSDYLPSVPLVPVLCLAQFFFALREQFQAPLRLSMQTHLLLPAAVVGVLTACLTNWRLIPLFGVYGAAWATVATYFTFSAVSLAMARLVAVHPYPFERIGAVLAGVCVTFAGFQALVQRLESNWLALAMGLALWLGWTLAMAAVGHRSFRQAQTFDDTAAHNRTQPAAAGRANESE
jgi:O-antigen/teichoic acid export membrane protein